MTPAPSGETATKNTVLSPQTQVKQIAPIKQQFRSAFLKKTAPASAIAEARSLHAAAAIARPMAAPVCLTISGGQFDGLTAAVILTGTQVRTLDVDGTGCDIAVYVAPGANARIASINVTNANVYLLAVDDGAKLLVTNTSFNNTVNPAIESIISLGTFTLYGSTVRHDGFQAAVDIEGGTATIYASSVIFGIDQVGVLVNGGVANVNYSDVLYKRGTTNGDYMMPMAVLSEVAVDPATITNLRSETIRIGDAGAGVIYAFGAGGIVYNTLVSGPGAIYGIRLINQGPVTVNDTTVRMTGASDGVLQSCDPNLSADCSALKIYNSTSRGDGNTSSVGYGFFNPGFTLYQDVANYNGTGYVTYCVTGFNTLSDLLTFLAKGYNRAYNSTVAKAAVVTNPADCTPPFP